MGDRAGDFAGGDFGGVWAPFAGAAVEDMSRNGPGKMGRPRLIGTIY